MRLLLTGATGNVGSHVLPELARRGHSVRAFREDIVDKNAVAAAVEGVDTVIHLAAVIPPGSDEDPERARAVNVDGTAHVIAARPAHRARLLLTSTFDGHGHTLDRTPPRH